MIYKKDGWGCFFFPFFCEHSYVLWASTSSSAACPFFRFFFGVKRALQYCTPRARCLHLSLPTFVQCSVRFRGVSTVITSKPRLGHTRARTRSNAGKGGKLRSWRRWPRSSLRDPPPLVTDKSPHHRVAHNCEKRPTPPSPTVILAPPSASFAPPPPPSSPSLAVPAAGAGETGAEGDTEAQAGARTASPSRPLPRGASCSASSPPRA